MVESVARLYAAGYAATDDRGVYLSFQEYFKKLRDVPERWGTPTAAVLGALMAQVDLGFGAIGGKDSMSGSFEELDVPPTLVSFAVGTGSVDHATSPEFKRANSRVVLVRPRYRTGEGAMPLVPEAESFRAVLDLVRELTARRDALAVATPGYGGLAEALFKMCAGQPASALDVRGVSADELFAPAYGSFVVELARDDFETPHADEGHPFEVVELGVTTEAYELVVGGEKLGLAALQEAWEGAIEGVFPYRTPAEERCRPADGRGGLVERAGSARARPHAGPPEGGHPGLPGHELRVRLRSRLRARGRRSAGARDQQPHARGRRREHEGAR